MKRKTSTLPTRIWTYGCRPPTAGGELIREQLWKAHRYYNKLIELELERRRLYREARSALNGTLSELESKQAEINAAIDKHRGELLLLRQSKRKRVADPVAVATLRALETQRKSTSLALKEARANGKTDPALLAVSERIHEETQKKVRAARAVCGVYWGTYLITEKAAQTACNPPKQKGVAPTDPRFKRWSGGQGRIGVQLHRERAVDVLAGMGTMLQIVPKSLPGKPAQTKSGLHCTVRIRVGSDEQKKPVWAEFPVLLHRMPPADAILTWAWILVRKQGPNTRYELQLSMESESFHHRRCGKGTVALDIGWRALPNGDIRVGYLVDDRGQERALIMPGVVKDSLDGANKLRGHSEKHFDTARQVFASWLATATGPAADWWRAETAFMHQWRAHAKLARLTENGLRALDVSPDRVRALWTRWRLERLGKSLDLFGPIEELTRWFVSQGSWSPGECMMLYLEWWRRKDHHLYEFESNQRATALRRRKDIYRNLAADLASTYETLVVEKFDLRSFARNEAPEDEKTDFTKRARTVAAPHELRGAILGAWAKARTVVLPCKDTTRECHLCHHVNKDWESPESLEQQCAGCGAIWDQDANAARILLHRWREQSGGPKKPGGGRSGIPDAGIPSSGYDSMPAPGE
jgi:hypothetical protein